MPGEVLVLFLSSSRQDFLHDAPMNVGEPEIASLKTVSEPLVVDAEQVKDRSL